MDVAAAVAGVLGQNAWTKEITVDTRDLSPTETLDLAKEIIDAGDVSGVPLPPPTVTATRLALRPSL